MGVKIEVLYTKETPFGEMIAKIREAVQKDKISGKKELIPLPFLERIAETRGMSVINGAVADLLEMYLECGVGVDWRDLEYMTMIKETNSLDVIWIIAHEMAAMQIRNLDFHSREEHRKRSTEIREWLIRHDKKLPDAASKMLDGLADQTKTERYIYDSLLASREAARTLLSEKQQPTTPMDIAAAKVLKAHSDAGTLESVSDEQLAQQVNEQYLKDHKQDPELFRKYVDNTHVGFSYRSVLSVSEAESPPVSEDGVRTATRFFKPIVIRVSEEAEKSDNYVACMAILRFCMMSPSQVISDRPRVMKTLKGKCNPLDGFFIQTFDDSIIADWMQLSKWIDEKGLMPC